MHGVVDDKREHKRGGERIERSLRYSVTQHDTKTIVVPPPLGIDTLPPFTRAPEEEKTLEEQTPKKTITGI